MKILIKMTALLLVMYSFTSCGLKRDNQIKNQTENTPIDIEESNNLVFNVKNPVNPNTKYVEENFSSYSNKRYGWGLKSRKDHQPWTVPQEIEKTIEKHNGIYLQHTDSKNLYLTFDEGYENGYTGKILDVLKANNTPAAFFITAPYLKTEQDLVKRMVDEGHIVGNHTVHHPSMPDVTDDKKLQAEILELENTFYTIFGKNMYYLRPPKGEYSERTIALTKALGYTTVFWSFAYQDYDVKKQKGAANAHKQVTDGLHNGAVLLLHAVSKDNAEALDSIIKDARNNGYEFKSLDDFK